MCGGTDYPVESAGNDQLIDGAYIEVGLKGEATKKTKSNRNSTQSVPISDVASNASTNENKIINQTIQLHNLSIRTYPALKDNLLNSHYLKKQQNNTL